MNAISTSHRATNCPIELLSNYDSPVFRGTLTARDGDRRFGRLKLDAETAYELGSNNVGLFVESCPSFERMIEHFQLLGDAQDSTWVVVASSRQVREELIRIADTLDSRKGYSGSLPPNVLVVTPEDLPGISDAIGNLAGILVFDYACHIHKCRGKSSSRFQSANDRPQKIVDFRLRFCVDNWSPPMLFFTSRRSLAVNTQPMLSPYCLEAFRYIDGSTMRFGKIEPITPQSSIAV